MSTLPIPGNVEAALEELGIEIVDIKDDEIIGKCPAHFERLGKQDSHPSWSVVKEDRTDSSGRTIYAGTHNCFSCGFKGPFVALVKQVLKCDNDTAEEWVRNRGGLERAKQILARKPKNKIDTSEQVNEASLALYIDPPKNMLDKRKLRSFSAKYYGIKWDESRTAWILPIRDYKGKLFGWQIKRPKNVFSYPKFVQKASTLFGLHKLAGTTGYLFEAPLDAARLHSVGIYGGLATYGSKISDNQLEILADRLDVLYICMDNDDAGIEAAWKIKTKLYGRLTLRFLDYDYIPGKDIGEDSVTDEDIRLGIKNYIPAALARMV